MVFARAHLKPSIRNVQVATIPTGDFMSGAISGLGNKGAVAASMEIFGTPLCFVSAHLSANKDKVDRREDDYRKVMSEQCFTAEDPEGEAEAEEDMGLPHKGDGGSAEDDEEEEDTVPNQLRPKSWAAGE